MDNEKRSNLIHGTDGKLVTGFTLSPPPSLCVLNEMHLFNWYFKIMKILKPFAFDYNIYPEVSSTGRLHFHGYFSIKDQIKYKKTINCLRKYGHLKLEKHISLNWLKYCQKDLEETKCIFQDVHSDYIPLNDKSYDMLCNDIDSRIMIKSEQINGNYAPILKWLQEE